MFVQTRLTLTLMGLAVLLATGCAGEAPGPAPATILTPPVGERIDVRRTIPLGFMLDEGSGARGSSAGAAPCFAAPAAHYAISRYVEGRPDRPVIDHHLYLYADVATAVQVFSAVVADVDALIECHGYGGAEPMSVERPSFGAEAFEVTIPLPLDGAGEHAGEPMSILLFRVGASIIQLNAHPGSGPSDTKGRGKAEMLTDAELMETRMCLYDPRCGPRPGRPEQVVELHDGDTVWAAVLGVFDSSDQEARPGAWVAQAAELGYGAHIVTAGCDVGAPPPMAANGTHSSYVAIYFDSESDAQVFAALLPGLEVAVFEATAYCVP